MFYNDWLIYKNNKIIISKDYKNYKSQLTLIDSLKKQAQNIYDSINNKLVFFLSGGIDSQTKLLGFIKSNIPIEVVFIRTFYNGRYNIFEEFYVKCFCKKYKINYHTFDVYYNLETIQELLLTKNYFNSSIGSGVIFQLDGIEKYIKKYGGIPVTSHGHFIFKRYDNTCSGLFWKPDIGLLEGIDINNHIIFDIYDMELFKFYENFHKSNLEIQFLKKIEAKNLFYMLLDIPFRPKLSGWEFLDKNHDYSKLSSIDFSNDHSKNARLYTGIEAILDTLNIFSEKRNHLMSSKPKYNENDCFIKLYNFETKIESSYLRI